MLKRFAFIAEGDVFLTMDFPDQPNDINTRDWARWIAAFSSDPKIIDVNLYPNVDKTYLYKEGKFYSDPEMLSPALAEESYPEGTFKVAVVVDEDVVGTILHIKADMIEEDFYRVGAGLSSDPKVLPCPTDVSVGWVYDGTSFAPSPD